MFIRILTPLLIIATFITMSVVVRLFMAGPEEQNDLVVKLCVIAPITGILAFLFVRVSIKKDREEDERNEKDTEI